MAGEAPSASFIEFSSSLKLTRLTALFLAASTSGFEVAGEAAADPDPEAEVAVAVVTPARTPSSPFRLAEGLMFGVG